MGLSSNLPHSITLYQCIIHKFYSFQVTRLSLLNAKLSKSLSMHNLATSFSSSTSETSSPVETPRILSPSTSQGSSLHLNLSGSLQKLHNQ